MAVIFGASSDQFSGRHTSRLIEPLMRWLIPGVTDATIGEVVFLVRKAAHLTEFGILAVLLWRAWRQVSLLSPPAWNWRDAAVTVGGCALYAASDEFHQLFVPSRQASTRDVFLDTLGAALGLALLWSLALWRRRRYAG